MTREQIVSVTQAMQRAWNARDPVALAALHADDGVVYSPMFGEVHGRPEIERSYREMFRGFGDWNFEGQELIIDGTRAAAMSGRGGVAPTSRDAESALQRMVESIKSGRLEGLLPFDRRGEPVRFA